ncbi:unnamed protein product [Prorocentrum cordatum]|uniref:LRAT domain-containing protein n=1 Tax=Prorocentrum cordatum TaxID=2364126 RepID=A0ABN9YHX2_9DINO|nr:unnamed protein product [Polarella glacialis]|mmetsp:Transcript_27345/g.71581  ORF Transcript_27345/g.71581 Transcript_27345/m.71581 type:complete len:246 (+) Transcript_27345:59-796(+)
MPLAALDFAVAAAGCLSLAGAQLVVPGLNGLIPKLLPELESRGAPVLDVVQEPGSSGFVFLQRYPLEGAEVLYHTEVLVCDRSGFSVADQGFLDETIAGMRHFAPLNESWWEGKTAQCTELGYGGASCSSQCCGVGHAAMPLNKRQAVIGNADLTKKALFVYGSAAFDGEAAFRHACGHKCWSNWAGTDYNPLSNNCNTFTSTVLSCVYGLSQKKPHLGVSDLVTVHCSCSGGRVAAVEHRGLLV